MPGLQHGRDAFIAFFLWRFGRADARGGLSGGNARTEILRGRCGRRAGSRPGIISLDAYTAVYVTPAVIEENWQANGPVDGFSSPRPSRLSMAKTSEAIDLGDWLSVDAVQPADETTPRILVATAYWAYAAQLMTQMAVAINRIGEGNATGTGIRRSPRRLPKPSVQPDATVGNGSQAGYVLALHFGLVPDALRVARGWQVVAEIKRRARSSLPVFLGTPYLIDVLLDTGHVDTGGGTFVAKRISVLGLWWQKGATTCGR